MKNFRDYINEAKSAYNVGDKVHVGSATSGESGEVTKTNGFGHTTVKTESGKEHKFGSSGDLMSTKGEDKPNKYLKLHTPEAHVKAKADLEKSNAEFTEKQNKEAEHRASLSKENDPVHKEIISKLAHHSGDSHLKNLESPKHEVDRHGNYNGSRSSSEVKDHGFPDLFHKVTKDVRISNASKEDEEKHGITHHGRISYSYQHPGGGSNGHDAGDFVRKTDGSIHITKNVHTGDDTEYGGKYPKFEHKVVKVIK